MTPIFRRPRPRWQRQPFVRERPVAPARRSDHRKLMPGGAGPPLPEKAKANSGNGRMSH